MKHVLLFFSLPYLSHPYCPYDTVWGISLIGKSMAVSGIVGVYTIVLGRGI